MANEVEQEQAEPADVPASVGAAYVVGIGASAGALSALRTLFGAMPRAPGFACVVVVHLSPEHDSHLVELLQPYTFMTVQQVRETTLLEPNNVYVIPPNANLEAIDTHVRLSALEQRRVERAPIDHFLRTLAKVHDGRAIGVILTGSGSDGSLGLRQIRERGGFTIAQDPQEAEFDSMPRRAILTDTVDCVLKLREIPGAIMNFCSSQPQLELKDGGTDTAENVALAEIVDLLRATTGQEFRFLRRSVMLRKIKRRMQMRRVATLEAYLEVLHTHKNEPRALCNDLLFIATDFFEDRELFGRIERDIVPAIFASKTDEGSRVRVWSIGCSTGEEAYSLAMLLAEQSARLHNPPATQVFASDLSPDTLMQAREGIYPHEVAETVSAERLGRFFHERGAVIASTTICATRSCSPSTTCCAIRRTRTSTSSSAEICSQSCGPRCAVRCSGCSTTRSIRVGVSSSARGTRSTSRCCSNTRIRIRAC